MKLISKLTLFITMSKLALVVLFVLTLPYLTQNIARTYTDYNLRLQKDRVLQIVTEKGVESYLQGEESYGSYTMLKDEYISLEPVNANSYVDTIYTSRRIVESDTLDYRVLTHSFHTKNQSYLLEVGKATGSIEQYDRPLQRIATVVLLGLILITMLLDLTYTRFLLHPLGKIIQTRLRNRKFPFHDQSFPIETTTTDFRYLDDSLISLMEQIHIAFEKEREFTANASHELMTPISILQNKIENLMDEPDVNRNIQERLLGMQKSLNRLKRIVHSLLLISRIDNVQFSKNEQVPISELVSEVIEEIEHRLSEREIVLHKAISNDITLIKVNRDLIFQMIYNLMNNAIKYNKEKGTIFISDELVGINYVINIRDTGIGIPQEEAGGIFDRFKKANKSEDEMGYGLGLAIVKSISDYHKIEISFTSDPGEGTNFKLVFPAPMVR